MSQSLSGFFFHWLTQDLLIIGAFAFVYFLLRMGARNERWQRAWVRLKKDRIGMIAFVVILLYMAIGAMEMLQVPMKDGGTRTLIDVFTDGIPRERSYSAPLATELLTSPRHE